MNTPAPFSDRLESTLREVFAYARKRGYAEAALEHLLLFLLDDADALAALKSYGVDIGAMRTELAGSTASDSDRLRDIDNKLASLARAGAGGSEEAPLRPSISFQRVLQRAVFHAKSSGRLPVTGANLLVAIFSEKQSRAAYLLRAQGMSFSDAVRGSSL